MIGEKIGRFYTSSTYNIPKLPYCLISVMKFIWLDHTKKNQNGSYQKSNNTTSKNFIKALLVQNFCSCFLVLEFGKDENIEKCGISRKFGTFCPYFEKTKYQMIENKFLHGQANF